MLVLLNSGVGVICAKGPGGGRRCGLVVKVDEANITAKFLRQSGKRSVDEKLIFTFKENDESSVDVLKKRPTPQQLCGDIFFINI